MTIGSPTDFVVSHLLEVGREIMLLAEDLIARNSAIG